MSMLLIDDRENPKVINKLLMSLGDKSVDNKGMARVARMESGDYAIGELGIEAKEINDLYNSIVARNRTRTVNDQLIDLQNAYKKSMLVVYGTELKPFIKGRATRQMYASQLQRMRRTILMYKMDFHKRFPDIQFMQFDTMDEFVMFLSRAAMNEKVATVASSRLPKKSKDARIQALSSLPGITVKTAKNLLRHFGSIPAMLRSKTSQSELMKVSGIGRQRAKTILSLRDSYLE